MTGKLYEKLIVQPSPTLPAYYNMVKRVLQECMNDTPERRGVDNPWEKWYTKWFGDN